jgi:hypothetical protein
MVHSIHHLFFESEEALSITHTIMVGRPQKRCENVILVGIDVGVNLQDSPDYLPFQTM